MVWGFKHPTPSKFRRLFKIVPKSTRLWKLLKIAEFRTPTPQDVREKGSKILKLPPVRNCFTLAMTNKLIVIINSPKVPKIKKILLYEMKFLVPNCSCLKNPWLGGYRPQIPVFLGTPLFEYQEYFMGVKTAGALGWNLVTLMWRLSIYSGNLSLSEPSGPVQAFTFHLQSRDWRRNFMCVSACDNGRKTQPLSPRPCGKLKWMATVTGRSNWPKRKSFNQKGVWLMPHPMFNMHMTKI